MENSKHTLNEFIEAYDTKKVILVFGDHKVRINFKKCGSYTLVKAFKNMEFYFLSYHEDTKVLNLVF